MKIIVSSFGKGETASTISMIIVWILLESSGPLCGSVIYHAHRIYFVFDLLDPRFSQSKFEVGKSLKLAWHPRKHAILNFSGHLTRAHQ